MRKLASLIAIMVVVSAASPACELIKPSVNELLDMVNGRLRLTMAGYSIADRFFCDFATI